jgi:hypothetical protein
MMIHVEVDFNAPDATRVAGLLINTDDLSASLTGETVLAVDQEGNRCRGRVVTVQANGLVELALDMDTFEGSSCHAYASAT